MSLYLPPDFKLISCLAYTSKLKKEATYLCETLADSFAGFTSSHGGGYGKVGTLSS
jgi:hypothetical protein